MTRARAGFWPTGRRSLLVVFCALAAAFILSPLLIIILNSFNSAAYSPFPPPGLSLHWYRNLLSGTGDFGPAALYTLALACLSTLVSVTVGTLASHVLQRRRFRGSELVRAGLLMPIVLPKILLGVGLFVFFSQAHIYGSLWSLALTHALISLPFVVAIVSAALVGADPSLEEASRDLGAGGLRTFWLVTFPQIRTAMITSALFAFIVSADQLESTILLTRPGRTTLPVAMYNYVLQYQDPTIAALSSLVIAVSAVLVILAGILLRRGDTVSVLGRAERGATR